MLLRSDPGLRKVDAKVDSTVDLLPRLYLPLFLVLCAVSSWFSLVARADFWAHAAVGRWIWEHGQVPRQTLFLWSASEPWVAHSWLSQLSFYGLMAAGGQQYGPYLVQLFTILLVTLTFTGLWLLWRRHARITTLTAFLFALAVQTSHDRFATRPELFTACFLSCLLIFLIHWPQMFLPHDALSDAGQLSRRGRAATLGLAGVFALWVNCHGAVAIGLILLAATVVCDLVQDRFSRQAKTLAGVALLCGAAVWCNPYGVHYWQALHSIHSQTFKFIEEWKAPLAPPILAADVLISIAIFIVFALAAWAMNPQRRWSQLAWLLVMSVLFLTARRNSWLLIVACLAVLAANARFVDTEHLWHELGRRRFTSKAAEPAAVPLRWRWLARWSALGCFGVWIALAWIDIAPLHPVSHNLPEAKLRFIREHHLRGRIFNDVQDSPYMEWKLQGEPPLFIDILNAYGDQVTLDYGHMMGVTARGRALLERSDTTYGAITYVVLKAVQPNQSPPPLVYFLDQSPFWKLIYNDVDGTVWEWRSGNGARPGPTPFPNPAFPNPGSAR